MQHRRQAAKQIYSFEAVCGYDFGYLPQRVFLLSVCVCVRLHGLLTFRKTVHSR
jgi:hypothetical protein